MIDNVLKSWRKDKEIGQREAATMVGVSLSTYCRIEQGKGFDNKTMLLVIKFLFTGADNGL